MDMLSTFIPIDRRLVLHRGASLPDRTTGAVLFADISGFTPLTAALTQELGPERGAEELSRQLNRIYSALIAEVEQYGGSVISFSGDAITCWFDAAMSGAATQHATACGLNLQRIIKQFGASTASRAGALGIKVIVMAGPARRFLVGHPRIQTIDVLAGSLLDRMAAAEQLAHTGEVLVGAEVVAQLGAQARVQAWRTSGSGTALAVIGAMAQPQPAQPWPHVPELGAEIARDWLLPPIYQRLRRGEESFLAELRSALAIFLKFEGIDYDRDDAAGGKLDMYIRWVQTTLARFEGYLLQLTVGDKGSYLYMAFGAPLAHEDDPQRAIAAALALQAPPPELGEISGIQIGMSQGLMHAGTYGAPTRQTYGVLGEQVNMAARLMSQAQPGQILVTRQVAAAAATAYEFADLGSTQLKGQAAPVAIFAVATRRSQHSHDRRPWRTPGPLVGRTAEQARLAEQLRALLDGQSGCVLIEGQAGIGKSRLVADLIAQACNLGIPNALGTADAIEQATPYYAWRPIIRQLFGLEDALDTDAMREHVLARLAGRPQLAERAPLLNAVLPLSLPETSLTLQLAGEVRNHNLHELLIDVLINAPRATATQLIVIEDAHWLDSASWSLLWDVLRAVPALLLVIVARPLEQGAAPAVHEPGLAEAYRRLLALAGLLRLSLSALTAADTLQLVCQRLGASRLASAVAEFILQRAEGHPFFSEELAYALRDAGLIRVRDGQCEVAADTVDLATIEFPHTIQGVITSRIDRLSHGQQLALKVASVIGRIFGVRLLSAIHPIEHDRAHVQAYVASLEQLDITTFEAPEPDLAYMFKHVITQEVAYHLLVFAQRRQLHQAIAEWYERHYADDLSPYYPLLAHHWTKAEVYERAIDYLEQAGEQAYTAYANVEAIYFFREALTLDARLRPHEQRQRPSNRRGVSAMQLRRARWQRQIGIAQVNLGNLAGAEPHLRAALAWLGDQPPASAAGWQIKLLGQLARQCQHRLLAPPASPSTEVLIESAQVYAALGAAAAVTNEQLKAICALLTGLNRAERSGASPQLALAAADMGNVAGFLGAHRLAQAYVRLATGTIDQINDLRASAIVYSRISIYLANVGEWARAEHALEQALAIAERLENRHQWRESAAILSNIHFHRGEFAACLQRCATICATPTDTDDTLLQAWGLSGQAKAHLRQGDFALAARFAGQTLALMAERQLSDPGTQIVAYAVLGLAQIYQGQLAPGQQAAGSALALLQQHPHTITGGMLASALVAEALLLLLERSRPADRAMWQARARQAGTLLFKCNRTAPISKAPAWLHWGQLQWQLGRPAAARRCWHTSLRLAHEFQMAYEAAMAHFELARHVPPDDTIARSERSQHQAQAIELFAHMGSTYQLHQAQALG